MNIATMVSLMGTLGIGESLNTNVAQETSIQFLNLAHDELFRKTANFNTDLLVDETYTSAINFNIIPLNQIPYLISRVYVSGQTKPLAKVGILELTDIQQAEADNQGGTPRIFANLAGSLIFYPSQPNTSYTFTTWYTPTRSVLTINTPESDIPYPLPYQPGLVDGGLYYQALAEGGFRATKASDEAKLRWLKVISDLEEYLKGFNTQTIHTYRNL